MVTAMVKIDTSGWKPFRVEELFETERVGRKIQVPTGSWIAAKNLEAGPTPRITVSGVNNGVAGYYKDVNDANYRVYQNFISVSFLGTVFYQANRASLDMKVHCLKPRDVLLNERIASFLVTMIRVALGNVEYSDQISSTVLPDLELILPADVSGEPDWTYMDEYMSAVMKESEVSLESLKQAHGEKRTVDTSEWKEFAIGKLFNVVKGTRLTKANMTPGDIRFIGSSAMNNGCTAMVGNTENMHPSNTITVCYNGSVGETFYQDQPFLASDDVNVLYPKFDMTREIALFIVPLIKSVSTRYNYIDKWKREDMIADAIKIPVDASGEPDWAYMDEYMRNIMNDANNSINKLRRI